MKMRMYQTIVPRVKYNYSSHESNIFIRVDATELKVHKLLFAYRSSYGTWGSFFLVAQPAINYVDL